MKKLLAALAILAVPVIAGPLEDAEALVRKGELDRAQQLLERATIDPVNEGRSLILLTRIFNAREDYKRGVEYGERAVEALPDSSEAHLQYAIAIRTKMSKVSKMRAMFSIGSYKSELRKAMDLDPGSADARQEEIGFLIHAPGMAGGGVSKARERIEDLKSIDWVAGMFMQAELQQKEGDAAGRIRTLQQVIEKHPDEVGARVGLSFALQAEGRYREADTHFAVIEAGDNPQRSLMARYQMGRSRVLGEYEQEKAVGYLTRYIEDLDEPVGGLPDRASAYWRLGMAYQQLDRRQEAKQAYEKALALDADHKQARAALDAL